MESFRKETKQYVKERFVMDYKEELGHILTSSVYKAVDKSNNNRRVSIKKKLIRDFLIFFTWEISWNNQRRN